MNSDVIRLSRALDGTWTSATWPSGLVRVGFDASAAPLAHALLDEAYRNGFGTVAPFHEWHHALVNDPEYDPALCYLYADGDGPAAFALVWTSGFIKDLAVSAHLRRKGLGTALLATIFGDLRARHNARVRLKVVPDNAPAIALYTQMGMTIER